MRREPARHRLSSRSATAPRTASQYPPATSARRWPGSGPSPRDRAPAAMARRAVRSVGRDPSLRTLPTVPTSGQPWAPQPAPAPCALGQPARCGPEWHQVAAPIADDRPVHWHQCRRPRHRFPPSAATGYSGARQRRSGTNRSARATPHPPERPTATSAVGSRRQDLRPRSGTRNRRMRARLERGSARPGVHRFQASTPPPRAESGAVPPT